MCVAQLAEAAPRDSGPPPDADFLEFIGSWHPGDDRWVDPFHLGAIPASELEADGPASRRPEAAGKSREQPEETTRELKRKSTEVTAPRKDVTP